MSRNFELLRRVERERPPVPGNAAPSPSLATVSELRASGPVYEPLFEAGAKPERDSTALWEGEILGELYVSLSETVRDKLTSLARELFLLPASIVRSVAVGATEPGTGVSAITIGLAECLSGLSSGRVCVMDMDLEHPKLQAHFRPRSPYGINDVLQGKASLGDALTRVASNLWILPAGGSDGRSMVHSTEGLLEILTAVRRETDYLLLHSPPLSDTNAAIAFGKMTDGVILVLEANRTRRDYAQMLKAKLDAAHVRVLGAVFNNRTFPIPEKIYSKL